MGPAHSISPGDGQHAQHVRLCAGGAPEPRRLVVGRHEPAGKEISSVPQRVKDRPKHPTGTREQQQTASEREVNLRPLACFSSFFQNPPRCTKSMAWCALCLLHARALLFQRICLHHQPVQDSHGATELEECFELLNVLPRCQILLCGDGIRMLRAQVLQC